MSPKELYEWALNHNAEDCKIEFMCFNSSSDYNLLTMEDLGISKYMNGSPETVLLNLNKGM